MLIYTAVLVNKKFHTCGYRYGLFNAYLSILFCQLKGMMNLCDISLDYFPIISHYHYAVYYIWHGIQHGI